MFIAEPSYQTLQAFAISLGIGLLMGLERERQPETKAGLRTFALVALLGCLAALLTQATGSSWSSGRGPGQHRRDDDCGHRHRPAGQRRPRGRPLW